MINRENYHLAKKHLVYRKRVIQNDDGTIATYWQTLKHLMQWADSRSFLDAEKIMPSFPEYILSARNDGRDIPLTPKYMGKALSHARAFFDWLRLYESGGKKITEAWIKTLQLRRSAGEQSRLTTRLYWKLEDVRRIIEVCKDVDDIRVQRDLAALSFLYLSGMRIGAFVTLPMSCVDIQKRKIAQLPERGVQTKNSKAAVTFLLPIPDLLAIVEKWDEYLHTLSVGEYPWYPPISAVTRKPMARLAGEKYTGRAECFKKGLKELCVRGGVPYKSPHKIRHGFGVYGVKNAKNIGQLKAISQNMMHANLGITDGIYGKLAEEDMADILADFGK